MDAVSEMDVSSETAQARNGEKARLFFGILAGVILFDVLTKFLIQQSFGLYEQVDIVGSYFRLTYIRNPGAAFGIHLGDYSRPVFLVLSLIALGALGAMYWATPAREKVRLVAISLICGGAIGNLIDRVRSAEGVVDFLDVGIGDLRWPIFNIADIAVTTGAVLLALSLWREEQEPGRRSGGGG